ncbi:MAG: hypothetical protein QNI92_05110 [Desulfobacterales bacterium]|nr:hypothetical protein [Desulfobacterales bacterium]
MKPGEIYALKRQNFVAKVTKYFGFLSKDYGYVGPEHDFHKQPNGTITCDSLMYTNTALDRQVVFYNAYHPVDYGFELQFYIPSISTEHADRVIAHYVLKENQDIGQTYLDDVVKLLKTDLVDVLTGQRWVAEK